MGLWPQRPPTRPAREAILALEPAKAGFAAERREALSRALMRLANPV